MCQKEHGRGRLVFLSEAIESRSEYTMHDQCDAIQLPSQPPSLPLYPLIHGWPLALCKLNWIFTFV